MSRTGGLANLSPFGHMFSEMFGDIFSNMFNFEQQCGGQMSLINFYKGSLIYFFLLTRETYSVGVRVEGAGSSWILSTVSTVTLPGNLLGMDSIQHILSLPPLMGLMACAISLQTWNPAWCGSSNANVLRTHPGNH